VNDTSDKFCRSVALEKALAWAEGNNIGAEQVVAVAEKFRAFLAGEGAAPEPFKTKDERPVFRLPRSGDGYVYFRFQDSYILYRSHAANGALVESADRISALHDVDWEPATGSLRTRRGLWDADGYDEISAKAAALIILKYVKGVRFE
jgi:hypothetical protein